MHLTDTEIIMLADGELEGASAVTARAHLDSCWTCREKKASLEATIGEFVRARNRGLEEAILPAAGPRALLRARMAEIAVGTVPSRATHLWGRILAAGACAAAVAGLLVVFEMNVSAEGRPNSKVTPGETRPISITEVCSRAEAEVIVRNIPLATQERVLARYGVGRGNPQDFEVDYLITRDLGGADTERNMWPQSYSARWNAKMKDRLEQKLHDLVCAGNMDLATAQREIATDWVSAYKRYVR